MKRKYYENNNKKRLFMFEGKIAFLKKKLKITLMEAVVKDHLWLIVTCDILLLKK